MRPLKFRAWDTESSEMFNPPFSHHSDCYLEVRNGEVKWMGYIDDDSYPKEREGVIMQFTGLLDKNGKEIYEGDIVRFIRNEHGFNNHSYKQTISFEINKYNAKFDFPCFDECEVIGNIYESP